MENMKKQLVLNKGSEKYIFRYEKGGEGQLLDAAALHWQQQSLLQHFESPSAGSIVMNPLRTNPTSGLLC